MNGKMYSRANVTGKSFLNILNRLQKDMMQLFMYSVMGDVDAERSQLMSSLIGLIWSNG